MSPAFKLVPVEPTECMLVNGREALLPLFALPSYGPLIGTWKDMLEVAPAPPVEDLVNRAMNVLPQENGQVVASVPAMRLLLSKLLSGTL